MTEYRTITEIAKTIRTELKKEFPKCKFSVTAERFSGGTAVNLSLMQADFNPVNNYNSTWKDSYAQLSEYAFMGDPELRGRDRDGNELPSYYNNGATLTKQGWQVMKSACEISNRENWDRSDSMVDYFDVNYYFHCNIGKWDKPFIQN